MRATVISHAPGLSGTPSAGQRSSARAKASCAQSSDPWSRQFPVFLEGGPHDQQRHISNPDRTGNRCATNGFRIAPVPTTDVDTPNLPAATSGSVPAPRRLCLDEARSHLAAADDALDGWYARQTIEGHTYVGDGHEAIRLVDAATRELYRVRAALVGEIRDDEDGRADRADRMIAEFKARRASDLSGRPDGAAPQDGRAA